MATIILRDSGSLTSPGATVKGAPLTNLEVDNNFSNINLTVGVVSDLTTTAKSNLVVAVNELVTSNTATNSRITSITSANIRQFATGTSADLAAIISDETGSGNLVFSTSPTLTTPTLGVATATSINKVAFTEPATGSTIAIADGKTLTASNTFTLASLADSTTYTFPAISANVGYMEVPQNSQSAAYTCVLADSGKHIFHPSSDANARTYTIPANSSVPYPIGTVIAFINMTSQVVSIAITTDTMYLGGLGSTGTRSLAQYGVANATKITSTSWIITGTGLT